MDHEEAPGEKRYAAAPSNRTENDGAPGPQLNELLG